MPCHKHLPNGSNSHEAQGRYPAPVAFQKLLNMRCSMGYRRGYKTRYRRKRSDAASIMADTLHIANRASWLGAAVLGVFLSTIFYWGIPGWINHAASTMQDGFTQQLAIKLLAPRVHWSQWFGIALGLVCAFFAIRNYFIPETISRRGEQTIGLIGKLLAKWLD